MMVYGIARPWEEDTVYRAMHTYTTKRLQVCGSRDKERAAELSRAVTAANEITQRDPTAAAAQGLDAESAGDCTDTIMSSQCTTPSSARDMHVPIREECCEIGRVCFGWLSVRSLSLFLPVSSHFFFLLLPLR